MNGPRVFISYSWDSPEHKHWVRSLAERLASSGINVRLDQWHVKPGESFTHFMEEEVQSAGFVLVICTPKYAAKSNSRLGGVGYEQQIVSGHIVSGSPRSKFIPVVREGDLEPGPNSSVPTHFMAVYAIDFRGDLDKSDNYEDLLRALLNKPRHVPPTLGPIPDFDNLRSDTRTSLSSTHGVIELDINLLPTGGEEALQVLVAEALENVREGKTPALSVVIGPYRALKNELMSLESNSNLSIEQRKRRIYLKQELNRFSCKIDDPETYISDLLECVLKATMLFGVTDIHEISNIILRTIQEHKGIFYRTRETRFDVVANGKFLFSFWISDPEAEDLAKQEGVPLGFLTLFWGLDYSDFMSKADRIIPRLVVAYLREPREDRNSAHFTPDIWKIGLG